MSECDKVVAIAELTEPPRIVTSASRAWVVCGFTTVTSKSLPRSEAEPFSPQKVAGLPSRSYCTEGAEKIVRSDSAPWWPAYISKTWPTGVTTKRSSCARYKLFRQLMSCAQLAM